MKNPAAWLRLAIVLVATGILLSAATAQAGSLTVAPVRVALSDAEKVQTLTVRNNGVMPARVQLRVFAWRQAGGEDVLEDTRDVLVNPVAFELAPSGEQIVRFGLRVGQGDVEKAYRIVVDEVPDDRAQRPGAIRTRLRIVLPIFVAPEAPPARRLTWSGATPSGVTLHNRGNTHVQVHRLSVTGPGNAPAAGQDMSTYLLAGTTRTVPLAQSTLSAPPAKGGTIAVRALTDAAAETVVLDREVDTDAVPRG